MKGSSDYYQPGVYGAQGTPDPANTPGARSDAVSWTGEDGVLWLFGGYGQGGTEEYARLNDLWSYDPATGNWTWVTGSTAISQQGSYGVPGLPDPANTPGARENAVSWTDEDGALWLFGGYGRDVTGEYGALNDFWKYNPSTGNWTWMAGSSTINQPGHCNTPGIDDPANIPGARSISTAWTDADGAMWLFGGWGYDTSGHYTILGDLWRATFAANPESPGDLFIITGNPPVPAAADSAPGD
jgi:N-acetylneuraminic acid mutarotase